MYLKSIICLCLSLVLPSHQLQPTVRLSVSKFEGVAGDRFTVKCYGNSPFLSWLDPKLRNITTVTVGNPRVFLDKNQNTSDLIFDPIVKDQEGVYKCENNVLAQSITNDFQLIIKAPPVLRPSVKLSNYKQEEFIGTSTSVLCSGNSPNLVWTDKYNRDLSSIKVPFIHVNQNPDENTIELLFNRVDEDLGGSYTCTNTIGTITENATFELLLLVPNPTVSLNVSSRIEKYPSQKLRVMCTSNSNAITWKNPTNTIIFQRTPRSFQDPYTIVNKTNLELVFDNIKGEHRGRYTCTALIKDMVEYKYFELQVDDIPTLEFSPSSDNVTLAARSSYKVVCKHSRVSGIQWFGPDNQLINGSSNGVEVKKALLYGMELKISRASRRLSGVYTCAGNVDGIPVRRSLAVTVTKRQHLSDPVFVSLKYSIMRKKVGESFSITCEAETSQLNWQRLPDFQPITNDTRKRVFSNDVIRVDDDTYSKKLEGHMLQLDDKGVYCCQVTDGIEIKNRSFTLMIIDPVSFASSVPPYYVIPEGLNVTLECGARGYPSPNIDWYKQNSSSTESISGDGYIKLADQLIIVNVTKAHAGTYTCYARQESIDGTYGERSMDLKVNHKPVFVEGNITLYNYVGRTMNLSCDVLSEPSAAYKWTKNGVYLSPSNMITVPFKDVNDFGIYTCEASNVFGTAARNINVVQSEKPNAPEFEITSVVKNNVHFKIKTDQKNVTHYVIQYAMVPGDTFSNFTFTKGNTTGMVTLIYKKTKYILRAASINNVEQSEFSKNVTITTGSSIAIRPPSLTMQLFLLSFIFAISCLLFGQ